MFKKLRYYFTFADLCGTDIDDGPFEAKVNDLGFADLFSGITFTDTTATKTLLQTYIYPRIYNLDIDWNDADEIPADLQGKIYAWLVGSIDKYTQLITLYSGQEAHLMDQIKSVTLSKYNDTPQDGGNFDTDAHTSNSTRTESSADSDTPINKLDEIRRKLRNIYQD